VAQFGLWFEKYRPRDHPIGTIDDLNLFTAAAALGKSRLSVPNSVFRK
jgi:hypothetical protein